MPVISAIVVTFNRKTELRRCIDALLGQTRTPDAVWVMDNASTDGTEAMVEQEYGDNARIHYNNLGCNLGGAGGFHYGSMAAFNSGADWVWMMDDDCLPTRDCLEKLIENVNNPQDIFSPIVLSIEDKATVLWGIDASPNSGNIEVATLPFNGFLIHSMTIKKIGPPEKKFFIYGDDTEYNLRARRSGSRIIMVTSSQLYHPHKNDWKTGRILNSFTDQIWVYYKLRNAIAIYRKYGYFSKNQWIMFLGALAAEVLTLKWNLVGLWFEALSDGLRGKIYLRNF